MTDLKVNIRYAQSPSQLWTESEERPEHLIERMRLRGIGTQQIKEAVTKGAKRIRSDGSVVTEYRWYAVIYREFVTSGFRKIYPITVIDS